MAKQYLNEISLNISIIQLYPFIGKSNNSDKGDNKLKKESPISGTTIITKDNGKKLCSDPLDLLTIRDENINVKINKNAIKPY